MIAKYKSEKVPFYSCQCVRQMGISKGTATSSDMAIVSSETEVLIGYAALPFNPCSLS
jgi:hypothetical protein